VDLLAHGPQRIYGIARKGRLTVGYDADLTIVDLGREHVITNEEQASRVGWTPFAGWKLKGWPVRTIVRGRSVMIDGQLQGAPSGRAVRFVETLAPQDETL
jgi:dihydroorotase